MQGSNLLYLTKLISIGDTLILGLFIHPQRILYSFIILSLLSPAVAASQSQSVRVSLTSDQARYIPGGSITVSVRVVNEGRNPSGLILAQLNALKFSFRTAKAALSGGGPMASILPRYLGRKF